MILDKNIYPYTRFSPTNYFSLDFHPQKIGFWPKSRGPRSRATLELRIFTKKWISIDFPAQKIGFFPKSRGPRSRATLELKILKKTKLFLDFWLRNPWAPWAPWAQWAPWAPWAPMNRIDMNRNRYEPNRVWTEPNRTEPGAPCAYLSALEILEYKEP